jgi:hypothetical protein
MAMNYTVKQGDCISSIAFENGFFPDTIWNHANNKELKEKRKDPNVLMPGDVVFVPDKRIKEVSEPTNQVYKFRAKNVPAKLSLRLLFDGEPRRNETYTIDFEGKIINGTTDSDGNITMSIPPNAKTGKLTVGTDEHKMEYDLQLGRLDPVDKISGVQSRLNNLGFNCGRVDGVLNTETKEALQAFQVSVGIQPSGELDAATKAKLYESHEKF